MSKLTDLIQKMKELGEQLDAIDEDRKPIQKEYDQLRLEAIPSAMAEEDIRSLTGGFGRCTLIGYLYVSAPDKTKLHDWLRKSGNESLIQPTVNAMTLKAFVKDQMERDKELPDDVLKITPFSRAVIYTK